MPGVLLQAQFLERLLGAGSRRLLAGSGTFTFTRRLYAGEASRQALEPLIRVG